jgi:hypothetical protein
LVHREIMQHNKTPTTQTTVCTATQEPSPCVANNQQPTDNRIAVQ